MLRVRYLLSLKDPALWSIGPEDPVLEAIQLMADKHIGALPVLKDGELVGIVSERDYARKVILLGRSSADTPVWQIMSAPVTTVTPEEEVHRCMEIMTAVNYQIPLNILLFNNQTLGLIRKNQYQQFEGRFLDCDFVNPDFALLAAAFGIQHFRIADEADGETLFRRIDLRSGINLIEFILDRDAYPNYVTHR